MNEDCAAVATYQYNAWGEIIDIDGELAEIKPLRYRGYYLDQNAASYYPPTSRLTPADWGPWVALAAYDRPQSLGSITSRAGIMIL